MIEYLLGQIPLVNFIWENVEEFYDQMYSKIQLDYKENQIESEISPQAKSNLWESNFNYLEQNEFFELKKWITNNCEAYIKEKTKKDYKFVITESWAHKTNKGGYHSPHYHNNCSWSGIFYLTNNTSGPNNLYLPYYIERKPGLDFVDDKFTIYPKKGNLILFPSCILHDAAPLDNNEERIVIAFNAECI